MPSLQLDVPATYDLQTKRMLAARLGAEYAAIMQAPLEFNTVVVRDRGKAVSGAVVTRARFRPRCSCATFVPVVRPRCERSWAG